MGCRIKLTEKKTPFFRIGTTRLRVAGVQRGRGQTKGLVLRKDSSHEAETGHTRELHTQGQITRGDWSHKANKPFYQYGGHIEFIRLKEYYEMPRGHSLSIYARFSRKKRTSLYIPREKGDHYYIGTRHNNIFLPLQSFSRKT